MDPIYDGNLTLGDEGELAVASLWNLSICGSGQGQGLPQSPHMQDDGTQLAILILYLTTFTFGFLGNTVTIYALVRTKRLKSVANCFILNLAIADDLFILTLPFTAHSSFTHSWVFGNILCKVMNVFRGVNLYASIFTMTLMSIDRYLAVVHPLDSLKYRTRRHAFVVCVIIWVVCLVTMTPFWLYARASVNPGGMMKCQISWPQESLNEHLWMWANFELVVGFLLPIIIMSVCYARLLRCLLVDSKLPAQRQGKIHVWRVTAMIFVVTLVFLVCWAPHHVIRLLSAQKNQKLLRGQTPGSSDDLGRNLTLVLDLDRGQLSDCRNRTLIDRDQKRLHAFEWVVANVVAQGLTFLSSCCNPFIYYITSTNFRMIYKTVLCGCLCQSITFKQGIGSSAVSMNRKSSHRKSGSNRRSFRPQPANFLQDAIEVRVIRNHEG